MCAEVVLESGFIASAAKEQPARGGIALSVAEDCVQPPSHLVDEVVHVALQAAVVVACEDDSPAAVDECPARKVDCLHAGKVGPIEDMPDTV